MAVAFSWDVLVTDALLSSIGEAGGLDRADALEPLRPTIARILERTGGVPIAERPLEAEERTRVARTLLHEATQHVLRLLGGRAGPSGYITEESPTPDIERIVTARARVPVNRANRQTLESLPAVGRIVAERLIDERQAAGPFATIAELTERVGGLGEAGGDLLASVLRFDTPIDLRSAACRVDGEFERDFARLVQLQDEESAEERVAAALGLLATQTAATPHPSTRHHLVREFPGPARVEAEAASVGVLLGSEYFSVLPELFAGAQATVDIAMFHIAFPSERHPTRVLLEALLAAISRGVTVRVLLDRDRPTDVYRSTVINTAAAEFLQAGGASVKFDAEDQLLHSKVVVIDGARAVIGSHNWSAGSYFHFDDISLVIDSAEFAGDSQSRFNQLWANA